MGEEATSAPAPPLADMHDIEQLWEHLEPGLKAAAMRTAYDEQQKLVIELQRQSMEKGVEIAIAVARARAALELQQEEVKNALIETELIPKQAEWEQLEQQITRERAMLDAFQRIGRGII